MSSHPSRIPLEALRHPWYLLDEKERDKDSGILSVCWENGMG